MDKKLVITAVVAFLAGALAVSMLGGGRFAGTTNLSGLAVGDDGFSVSGTSSFTGAITNSGAVTNSSTVTNSATTTQNGALNLEAPLTHGAVNSTSTTATSQTLAVTDLYGYSSILMTPNVDSVTLTLPATSTMNAFVPNAGDWRTILLVNGTTTAAKTVSIAAGTGTLLKNASTTAAVGPGSVASLMFIRKANTDIDVLFVPGI